MNAMQYVASMIIDNTVRNSITFLDEIDQIGGSAMPVTEATIDKDHVYVIYHKNSEGYLSRASGDSFADYDEAVEKAKELAGQRGYAFDQGIKTYVVMGPYVEVTAKVKPLPDTDYEFNTIVE